MKNLLTITISTLLPLTASAEPTRVPDAVEIHAPAAVEATDRFALVEKGFAKPGSAMHQSLMERIPGVAPNIAVHYSFSTNEPSLSLASLLQGATPDAQRKSIGFDPPAEPDGGNLGSRVTRTDPCYAITVGAQQATATMTWSWSYEFRDDSDGDGSNDANPGWVLTGFSASDVMYVSGEPDRC